MAREVDFQTRSPTRDLDVAEPIGQPRLGVSTEERHRLAECCAFFRADHYREASPDTIRHEDVEWAESKIDEIIRNCGC